MNDGFNGDNAKLCESIRALLDLDSAGALEPNRLGGHARTLLSAAASRLRAKREASTEPSAYNEGAHALRLLAAWREKAQAKGYAAIESAIDAAPAGGVQEDEAKDAARYKAEQRSMIIGQAVAHHRFEWPEALWTGVMFFNGERITKAEFDARAVAAIEAQAKAQEKTP